MAQYIEDFLPPIQSAGLNTAKSASFSGALTISGSTVSITTTTTSSTGTYVSLSATSTGVAGGYVTPIIAAGTGTPGIYFGASTPTINAFEGSLYLNVNNTGGTPDTMIYVRTSTTWRGLKAA